MILFFYQSHISFYLWLKYTCASKCYKSFIFSRFVHNWQVPSFWPKRKEWLGLETRTIRAPVTYSNDCYSRLRISVFYSKYQTNKKLKLFLLYICMRINWVSVQFSSVVFALSWPLQTSVILVDLFSSIPLAQVAKQSFASVSRFCVVAEIVRTFLHMHLRSAFPVLQLPLVLNYSLESFHLRRNRHFRGFILLQIEQYFKILSVV